MVDSDVGLNDAGLIFVVLAVDFHLSEDATGGELVGRGHGVGEPIVEIPFVVQTVDDFVVLVELRVGHFGQMFGAKVAQ